LLALVELSFVLGTFPSLSLARTLTFCRGFNDVTSKPWNAYYQIWNGKTPTINTGADGLENFGRLLLVSLPSMTKVNDLDNVVAAAKAKGIKLIVAL